MTYTNKYQKYKSVELGDQLTRTMMIVAMVEMMKLVEVKEVEEVKE